jgi:hypothetical protein
MSVTLRRRGVGRNAVARFAFMMTCLIVVLLVAPITWTTNLVWLAPVVALVMLTRRSAVAIVGLALLILPDAIALGVRPRSTWLAAILGARYLIALLCLLPYTLRAARGRVAPS